MKLSLFISLIYFNQLLVIIDMSNLILKLILNLDPVSQLYIKERLSEEQNIQELSEVCAHHEWFTHERILEQNDEMQNRIKCIYNELAKSLERIDHNLKIDINEFERIDREWLNHSMKLREEESKLKCELRMEYVSRNAKHNNKNTKRLQRMRHLPRIMMSKTIIQKIQADDDFEKQYKQRERTLTEQLDICKNEQTILDENHRKWNEQLREISIERDKMHQNVYHELHLKLQQIENEHIQRFQKHLQIIKENRSDWQNQLYIKLLNNNSNDETILNDLKIKKDHLLKHIHTYRSELKTEVKIMEDEYQLQKSNMQLVQNKDWLNSWICSDMCSQRQKRDVIVNDCRYWYGNELWHCALGGLSRNDKDDELEENVWKSMKWQNNKYLLELLNCNAKLHSLNQQKRRLERQENELHVTQQYMRIDIEENKFQQSDSVNSRLNQNINTNYHNCDNNPIVWI